MDNNLNEYFNEIQQYAHFRNWAPDIGVLISVYQKEPLSFSILIPFLFSYLEEVIRSMTSGYTFDTRLNENDEIFYKTGKALIETAKEECANKSNITEQEKQYVCNKLQEIKERYYQKSTLTNYNNRNSIMHGPLPPRFWTEDLFVQLIKDIASLSKYSGF